ncbi:hypothetical protein [Burkholderia ubonensis]|nr:hypothetical protein [Burkholderia ubonensis]
MFDNFHRSLTDISVLNTSAQWGDPSALELDLTKAASPKVS